VSNCPPQQQAGDGPALAMTLPGIAYDDDIAVQAFARHLTAAAEASGGDTRVIVAGMRAFLEGKPGLLPDPPWSTPPPTGYRAVELLAGAAGCSQDDIARARLASRLDLAGSAWILDPADGLADLLELAEGRARIVAVADRTDPATGPVLDALDLTGRLAVVGDADLTRALGGGPALLIDIAWAPRLADAHAAGHTTALIERFGSGDGRPDLRARDLRGLLPDLTAWLDVPADREGAVQ
jgi:hypothetical protein